MLSDIPEVIEWLTKYFWFRKSRKRNQRAALITRPVSWGCFFFSALASQLFSFTVSCDWACANYTVRQPNKEAVIKGSDSQPFIEKPKEYFEVRASCSPTLLQPSFADRHALLVTFSNFALLDHFKILILLLILINFESVLFFFDVMEKSRKPR